jgi:mono/diheme cytochrome c family protein
MKEIFEPAETVTCQREKTFTRGDGLCHFEANQSRWDPFSQSRFAAFFGGFLVLCLAGCDAAVDAFPENEVYAMTLARSRDVPTEAASEDVGAAITQLFGTPNEPVWPAAWVDAGLQVSQDNLRRAAGPQLSEEDGTHLGLFREHCVVCHSVSGSGHGPASVFQNPYPRDFRPGIYKWKSTTRDAKPTRDDLLALLHNGVAGSSMPSFSLIDPADVDALVDYIIYLSVRGETERELLAAAVDELGYGEDQIDEEARLVVGKFDERGEDEVSEEEKYDTDGAAVVREIVAEVTAQWADAGSSVVAVPEFPSLQGEQLAASIARGEELFHGQIANCVGCHGQGGNGGAVTLDYDDWTKEYSTRLGLTPTNRDQLRPFKKAGAPTPRLAKPRKISSGVFRGGGDAQTLYRRITQGIAGSPMPGVAVTKEENGMGLTETQVFDIVRYVQFVAGNASLDDQ